MVIFCEISLQSNMQCKEIFYSQLCFSSVTLNLILTLKIKSKPKKYIILIWLNILCIPKRKCWKLFVTGTDSNFYPRTVKSTEFTKNIWRLFSLCKAILTISETVTDNGALFKYLSFTEKLFISSINRW